MKLKDVITEQVGLIDQELFVELWVISSRHENSIQRGWLPLK